MDVLIIATKACTHRKKLEKELDHLWITCRTGFVEDTAPTLSRSSVFGIRRIELSTMKSCSGNSQKTKVWQMSPVGSRYPSSSIKSIYRKD